MSTNTTTAPAEGQEDILDGVIQPADALAEDEATEQNAVQQEASKEVARQFARMDLTLNADADPNSLSGAQLAALKAIVNFDLREQGAWPQVIAFMHLCVKRGLDPFAREAYLIARGREGSNQRKWTTQTGIEGYRILAARTGKFIQVKDRVWTGADDDEKSWRWDDRAGIMRRVWFDQWPASRGFPGAARVTIVHYDDRGNIVETQYVADWDMYCPMFDEYEGAYPNRKKTGRKAPGEMWQKGGPMMLSKCCEAAGLRMAIPGGLNGLYIPEEMHRADQIEIERQQAQTRNVLSTAHAAAKALPVPDGNAVGVEHVIDGAVAQQPGEAPAGPLLPVGQYQDIEDAVLADEPTPEPAREPEPAAQGARPEPQDQPGEQDAPTTPEAVSGRPAVQDPGQRRNHLRAEVSFMATVMDKPKEELLARKMAMEGAKDITDLSADALAAFVVPMRQVITQRLRTLGRAAEADAYARVEPDQVGPVEWLLGG